MLFLQENPALNETENYIYDFICRNTDRVVYMRIRDLAEAVSVSPSTIMRFCSRFHCAGYSEFRFRLQEYLSEKEKDEKKPLYDVSGDIHLLERIREGAFDGQFAAAAELFRQSEILIFMGMGSSGIAARYGQYLFSSFSGFSTVVTDPGNEIAGRTAESIYARSCVIALSVSGETRELVDYAEELKRAGARIISITARGDGALARLSDLSLVTYREGESIRDKDMTSQVPVFAMLECLARYADNCGV